MYIYLNGTINGEENQMWAILWPCLALEFFAKFVYYKFFKNFNYNNLKKILKFLNYTLQNIQKKILKFVQ